MCWVSFFWVPSTLELLGPKAFSHFVFLESTGIIVLTLGIVDIFFFPYLNAGL